jgi:hypothetical protein
MKSLSSCPDHVEVYRDKITEEICKALGFSRQGTMSRFLGPLFRYPARRFAKVIARADDEVRSSGLSGGSRRLLADLSLKADVRGAENIPKSGPLLVVSNHPGAYDSIVIMSCVPRKDLKVVLSDVALTRAFSAARQYFIYAPLDTAGRRTALLASIDHLKSGGALLLFAHDEVEPDPETGHGAMDAIQDWSRSIEIMVRSVVDTRLQVVMASGILMSRFLHSPLVKLQKSAPKRQKLAGVMQIIQQIVFPRSVQPQMHLSFGTPVKGKDLPGDGMMPAVIDIARRLLADHLSYVRSLRRVAPWDDQEVGSARPDRVSL